MTADPWPASLEEESEPTVRVLIVDDSPDIRTMLRLMLGRDGRFEVVGEGEDGQAAIALAAALEPDLVVLDRQMPVMGGLEAIPAIRSVAPGTAIILYTAAVDSDTEGLALRAGAIGLLEKSSVALGVAQQLAGMLARRWSEPDAGVEVRIGPVAADAARNWVANTVLIMAAIRAHPEIVWPAIGGPVDSQILDLLDDLLASWKAVAASTDTFLWVGRMNTDDIRTLVEEWARLDAMGDDTVAALGCAWSGPTGTVFFQSLTEGVVHALARNDKTRRLAERLAGQGWPVAPKA